ncbi:pirin family protein [Aquisediminimonas profunda]|uniref:pirin family protein n=1 Tax=Aquisediminimonas profunda TaxID=1550733 RepID=UPI001C6261F6|nr:pirin family protein [Aquisediminimonas profunda]
MRKVAIRTRGRDLGPITRLVSPGDLGELIKPFVFLDLATPLPGPAGMMRWHPHSGIATVTVIIAGAVRYQETTGTTGELGSGAVEWMASGGGVWHTGAPIGTEQLLGFQLWVALPPERENLQPHSQYLNADMVLQAGPARIILGEYAGVRSAIDAPKALTYLDVRLRAGEEWTFAPPPEQSIAWLAVHGGEISCSEHAGYGDMLIFDEGMEAITITAITDSGFVLGSAAKHPYDLHIGNHSVHTSAEALARGEAEIARIGSELRAAGMLR